MSMAICYSCDGFIDTDEDLDCYDDVGHPRCENCREDLLKNDPQRFNGLYPNLND